MTLQSRASPNAIAKIILTGITIAAVVYTASVFLKSPNVDPAEITAPQVGVEMFGQFADGGAIQADIAVPTIKAICGNPNVKTLVLYLHSEGGMPSESERIAGAITRYCSPKKEVIAVVEGKCLSACYMVAIRADKIYANRYGHVGAVGVVLTYVDYSQAMAKEGVEQKQIASGPKKGGIFGETLITPAQMEDLQDSVDASARTFIAEVNQYRKGKVKPEAHIEEGGTFANDIALELGLVDEIRTIDEIRDDYPAMVILPGGYAGSVKAPQQTKAERMLDSAREKVRHAAGL